VCVCVCVCVILSVYVVDSVRRIRSVSDQSKTKKTNINPKNSVSLYISFFAPSSLEQAPKDGKKKSANTSKNQEVYTFRRALISKTGNKRWRTPGHEKVPSFCKPWLVHQKELFLFLFFTWDIVFTCNKTHCITLHHTATHCNPLPYT